VISIGSKGTYGYGCGQVSTRWSERLAAEDAKRRAYLDRLCAEQRASPATRRQASLAGLRASRARANDHDRIRRRPGPPSEPAGQGTAPEAISDAKG
jgi:hypothetical protein